VVTSHFLWVDHSTVNAGIIPENLSKELFGFRFNCLQMSVKPHRRQSAIPMTVIPSVEILHSLGALIVTKILQVLLVVDPGPFVLLFLVLLVANL